VKSLKDVLGTVKLPQLNRERLIEFGRKRAKQGAGPATLAIDVSFVRTIVSRAAAVHGVEVSAEEVRLARIALSHLDLGGAARTGAVEIPDTPCTLPRQEMPPYPTLSHC
jgi:hypothetical protein